MKDRELGYIFTAKTRLIDPEDTRGEFGMGGQDGTNDVSKKTASTYQATSRSVNSAYEKSVVILNEGLLACANAIGVGLGGISASIDSYKTSFAPSESTRDQEIIGIMHQLQSRIIFLERQGGPEAAVHARSLQKKLDSYEDDMLDIQDV